jgi:hypothetical protein
MARFRVLRVLAVVTLALLAFQFEMGMSLNLSPRLQETAAANSLGGMWKTLAGVGADALTHGVLGTALAVLSIWTLVLALRSGTASVTVLGLLAFLSTVGATVTGVIFTASGFHNDGASEGMATMFLLTFSFHFILVCILSVRLRGQAAR